jgi:hypothetical protein
MLVGATALSVEIITSRSTEAVRTGRLETCREPLRVTDVGNDGAHRDAGEVLSQVSLDVEDAVLPVPEQGDAGGIRQRDLAAQFAADGATGAGHQYTLAGQVEAGAGAGDDLVAPQQIGDVDLPQTGDGQLSIEQLEHTGHDPGERA